MAPFVRRAVMSREFTALLRKPHWIDIGAEIEAQRTIRVGCVPSAVSQKHQNLEEGRREPGPTDFRATDQQSEPAEGFSSRRKDVDAENSEAKEEPAAARVSRRIPQSQEDSNPPSIPDRDWEIITIIDRKDVKGLLLYQVRWGYTQHPTAILQDDERGDQVVMVDGEICKVLHRSTTRPDEETGEHTSVVEWPEQWLPLWQLCSASTLVAEYELKNPREVNSMQPPFALQREPWKVGPEDGEDIDKRGDIEGDVFEPESGVDYTMSFLAGQLQRFNSTDGLRIESALGWLNMPVRQRLVFNDWFCARDTEEAHSYDAGLDRKHRALHVYVVGDAWVEGCGHCQDFDQHLPFSKCVTLDADFMGACTNCVYMGRGKACDLHHDVRSKHIAKWMETHAFSGSSSPTSSSSPTAESPIHSSSGWPSNSAPVSTPPTSPSGSPPGATRWVSASPPPRPSPELGSADFRGMYARDQPNENNHPRQQISDTTSRSKSATRKRTKMDDSEGDQESPKAKKDRRKKRKKLVKREQTALSDTPADLHRDTCPGGPCAKGRKRSPCTHPTAGCPAPSIEDDSAHPPHVVFNSRRFRRGEATDDEIRYILSCCWCETTQKLQDLWDAELKAVQVQGGECQYDSKEDFLSIECFDVLTSIARTVCPVPSWDRSKKIVIDLT